MNVMTPIRQNMPLLAAAEGVWEGIYRYYDAESGDKIDEHKSRLLCRLPEDGAPADYHQTNYYYWADGRQETREFPANFDNGRIWWDNDFIKGWCAPMSPDDNNLSMCLHWERKKEEGVYLYEMIQVDHDNRFKSRTWQWFRNGKCFMRTLIDEKFITRDWQNWDNFDPPKL